MDTLDTKQSMEITIYLWKLFDLDDYTDDFTIGRVMEEVDDAISFLDDNEHTVNFLVEQEAKMFTTKNVLDALRTQAEVRNGLMRGIRK